MKHRAIVVLLFLFLMNKVQASGTTALKVLQLNTWHATSKVPGGFAGLVKIIHQTDADILLLCELNNGKKENLTGKLTDTLQKLGKFYYGNDRAKSAGILSRYPINYAPATYSDVEDFMTKAYISVAGRTLAVYSAHLDYTNYACYLPRGYSGTTWKKLDAPVLDVKAVLQANRMSRRDEAIAAFVKDAKEEIRRGNMVLMGGDLNEPSHLDWQADTKHLRDHNGLVVNWDCSFMLSKMGMVDVYRKKYRDAVRNPGFTYPSANSGAEPATLTWAPEADERERIDFIYYYPNRWWILSNASIVGPEESICRGKVKANDSDDVFITPEGVWPTDHKGNLAVFKITTAK